MDNVIRGKKNSPLHWAIYHGDYATSLLVYLMEPLQIFYRNEQMKTPFDIVWDLKDLSKEKFYDGLYIIEHLSTFVMNWLDIYISKKGENKLSFENDFIVKGKNLMKNMKVAGRQTANLFNNLGQVVGITDNPDQDKVQHDDNENEALKNKDLRSSLIKDIINDQNNIDDRKKSTEKFTELLKSKLNSTDRQEGPEFKTNKEKG